MKTLHLLIVACACVFAFEANAQMTASLGTSVMFEAATNGRTLEQRQPLSVRGGYRFAKFEAYADYSRLEVSSGTSYVGVTRQRDQLLGWARVAKRDYRIIPYAALGAGVLIETIKTRLASEDRSDSSGAQPVAALAVGAGTPLAKWLDLSLEARVETSNVYAAYPIFGLGLFASATF